MKSLIARTKDTCCGMARIRGTRVTAVCIKYWSEGKYSPSEIVDLYPHLTIKQVLAALNYRRKEKIKS